MTPPATTPAARRRAAKRATGAPVAPRRVSGPVRGRSRTFVTPEPERRTRPLRGRRRRTSGPVTRRRPIGERALAFVRGLPDRPLLDRAIRGRAWIPILGVMLAGIVAMQVEVLKLGASMGRSIQQGTALQSRNDLLRASVASLADDQRIERLAAGMGMVMPAPAEVAFLTRRPGDAAHAARNIHTPDATTFLTSLSALSQASTAQAQGVTPAVGTSTSTPTTSGTPVTTALPTTQTSSVDPATTASGTTSSTGTTDPSATDPSATDPSSAATTTPTASTSTGATTSVGVTPTSTSDGSTTGGASVSGG
jgi:hypothetical protein